MAQKIETLLTDDLDGTEAAETITFGVDGATYEIDLNEANAADLREVLAPYVTAGRKADRAASTGPGRRRRSSNGPVQTLDLREVRSWAREQGMEVADRGRVPGDIVERYRATH